MQPVLTQVPPKSFRSMMATFIPAPAKRWASGVPACPVPIIIASNVFMHKCRGLAVSRPVPEFLKDQLQKVLHVEGARLLWYAEPVADHFCNAQAALPPCVRRNLQPAGKESFDQ